MDIASNSNIHQLTFGGATTQDSDSFEHDFDQLDEQRHQEQGVRRPSAYVDVFESMVNTILDHESFLLSKQEINTLDHFRNFCYNTRYCLIRLVLRKPDRWYAISTLQKFREEVGEKGLLSSMEDLCQPLRVNFVMDASESKAKLMVADIPIKTENDSCEIIGLTSDTGDSCKLVEIPANPAETNIDFFCENETKMSLEDILWQLNRSQLLELGKLTRCKYKSGSKKADIIVSLLHTAASQSVLTPSPSPIRKGKEKAKDKDNQRTLSFVSIGKLSCTGKSKRTQEHRLRQMALELLGNKCYRINFNFYELVRRINIICYREKESPVSLMLPALLTIFKKRNYPPYEHTRDSNIWTCREDFLEYEKALEVEKALKQIMETPTDTDEKRATNTPGSRCERVEFMIPIPIKAFTTPLMTPGSVADMSPSGTPRLEVKKEEKHDQTCLHVNGLMEEELKASAAITKDQKMINFLSEFILPKWQQLLSNREAQDQVSNAALERFETGYVYTRMVDRAARSFGPLKKYDDELTILNYLLSQKYWRRGKRANWYIRRAIIQKHLMGRGKDKNLLLESIQGIEEALSDKDTGIVWQPNLKLRLRSLKKQLGIPPEACDGGLRKPQTIEVRAVRVYPTESPINGNLKTPRLHSYLSVTKKDSSQETKLEESKPVKKKLGQRSSWKGRDGQIVNVETRALEHYEDLGYKGFHCETKLLTTLFALLFWDVIFANIPGALETPFQDAPLDLFEDTFYYARKDLIDERLKEILDGKGLEILQRHDEQYREKETWCLGLSWNLCERKDLVDIVKCLGEDCLSRICELFCQDYRERRSGGPDLFIWNAEQRVCKFVEVKGPGDTPQENQKLWFDGLLGANAAVEICKVIDITDCNPIRGKKRKGDLELESQLGDRRRQRL